MTFELKELSTLKKEFNDAVDVLLRRDKKGKIEDLSNPRKYELQYLSSILNRLEEQINERSMKSQFAAITFYGAMLTVMRDIENKRGMLNSSGLLNDSLADIIGINAEVSEENKPSIYQTNKFYTSINEFLKQIFVNNDSRQGFKKDHILRAIPTAHLSELVETSYLLSTDAEKAIVNSLVADGQTTVVFQKPNNVVEQKKEPSTAVAEKREVPVAVAEKKVVFIGEYQASKKAPQSAVARFGSWEKLNHALDDLLKDELAHKSVSKINKIYEDRATQLLYLTTLIKALQTKEIDESEKIAILAGAMHLVRKQIDIEYATAIVTSPDNSIIHKGLDKILGKTSEVAPQDVESLICSTTQFMRFLTIEHKTDEKKAIRSKHLFSEIAGFELKDIFNLCIDMIQECRINALHHVIDEFKKEGKGAKKPPKGYIASALLTLSILTSTRDVHGEEELDDEDELQHKNTDALYH